MINRQMVAPAIVFSIYISSAVWLLLSGHPHEDAYILNIYARNLAEGDGFSYFAGGPPAEGASDFLWMLLLALAERFNADAALIAHILNATGLAIVTWLAIELSAYGRLTWHRIVSVTLLVALIATSQMAQASLAGFSTGFYCGVIALLFWLLYHRNSRHLLWIPVVSIVIALIRPDGVIIGITATIVGLYTSWRAGDLNRYLAVSAVCFCVGAGYFAWRLLHFEQWLPLPLIVKSAAAQSLPGWTGHIEWASHNFYLGVAALIGFVLLSQRWTLLLASLPVGSLLILLMFGTLSQNIADRFQAPATVVLMLWCAIFLGNILREGQEPGILRGNAAHATIFFAFATILVLASSQSIKATSARVSILQAHQYINTFPFYLAPYASSDTRVALTEAGRFAYWLPGQKFDLVGLNTAEFANTLVSPDAIASLRADLIFVHIAGNADFSAYCENNFCELTADQVRHSMRRNETTWPLISDPVVRAPLAALSHYLVTPEIYQAYAVRYGSGYHHFYLLRSSGSIQQHDFEWALHKSFEPQCQQTYWQLRHGSPALSGQCLLKQP